MRGIVTISVVAVLALSARAPASDGNRFWPQWRGPLLTGASALTDGERVYAFFGSRGLYALDMKGNVAWEKDLGDMTTKLGFGEGPLPRSTATAWS